MSDIVERLCQEGGALRIEAASEIERLRAALREIKRLLDADCYWLASETVDAALAGRDEPTGLHYRGG